MSERQETIVAYMYDHGKNEGYTTREMATVMDTSTGAVLNGLKRLRKSGRVFQIMGKWYLSGNEIMRKDKSATEANASGG